MFDRRWKMACKVLVDYIYQGMDLNLDASSRLFHKDTYLENDVLHDQNRTSFQNRYFRTVGFHKTQKSYLSTQPNLSNCKKRPSYRQNSRLSPNRH